MAPGVELSLRTVSRFSSSPRTSEEGDLEHCAHSHGLNGGSSCRLLVDNTIKRFKLGPSFLAPPVRVTGESVPVCTHSQLSVCDKGSLPCPGILYLGLSERQDAVGGLALPHRIPGLDCQGMHFGEDVALSGKRRETLQQCR